MAVGLVKTPHYAHCHVTAHTATSLHTLTRRYIHCHVTVHAATSKARYHMYIKTNTQSNMHGAGEMPTGPCPDEVLSPQQPVGSAATASPGYRCRCE